MEKTPQKTRGRRRWRAWLGRILIGAVGLGVAAALVAGALPKPVVVDLGKVRRGPLRITVNDDGRTRVKDRYTISSPLTGNLARVELRPGDPVKLGQVLLRLQPLDAPLLDVRARAEAEARLASAQAAKLQAKAGVERARVSLDLASREARQNEKLASRGAIASQTLERSQLDERARSEDLASARFATQVADHQVELARVAVTRLGGARRGGPGLEVSSPIDGRVLKVMQQSAGVVQAGAPLLEIGDPSALEIVVDVLTQDAVQIPLAARASIERWGGSHDLSAHVRAVEPSAFTRVSALGVEEQRVNVVLDLDEDRARWAALGDGYRVECRITTWEGKDVLSVPLSVVFRDGERWAVFVAERGRAVVRPVTLGHRGDMEVEVTGGVREGEAVVLHPSDQVKAGVKIEAR